MAPRDVVRGDYRGKRPEGQRVNPPLERAIPFKMRRKTVFSPRNEGSAVKKTLSKTPKLSKVRVGAESRTRTGTGFRPADFKSAASTHSAIPAGTGAIIAPPGGIRHGTHDRGEGCFIPPPPFGGRAGEGGGTGGDGAPPLRHRNSRATAEGRPYIIAIYVARAGSRAGGKAASLSLWERD